MLTLERNGPGALAWREPGAADAAAAVVPGRGNRVGALEMDPGGRRSDN